MTTIQTRFTVLRSTLLANQALLLALFVFGMMINLFVSFPDNLPGGNAFHWAFGNSAAIQIHLLLGALLLLGAVAALVLSLLERHIGSLVASALGLLLTIAAFMSGMTFLASGQQNSSSLMMALGFLGALVAYAAGYYATRERSSK